jgi:menaquinone-9 beta-reductase
MPDHMRYDVAIVGASISGCAAAILFGREGARVALVERAQDPAAYKKICTHYIQPSATPTIEPLGLATAIEMAGGLRNEVELFRRVGLGPSSPAATHAAESLRPQEFSG